MKVLNYAENTTMRNVRIVISHCMNLGGVVPVRVDRHRPFGLRPCPGQFAEVIQQLNGRLGTAGLSNANICLNAYIKQMRIKR